MSRRVAAFAVCCVLVTGATADAQAPTATSPAGSPLDVYMQALGNRRLIASETGSIEALRALVSQGETLYLAQRYDDAVIALYEAIESPRFVDFAELPEVRSAELMLGGALHQLGALGTAARYLDRVLARGPSETYFAPALRMAVDVALETGDPGAAAERILAMNLGELPEDATNELRYLRARDHYDAGTPGDHEAATSLLSEVTENSRFYASAQYLLGAMAARSGRMQEAEDYFCAIADTGDDARHTFYVDGRYFEIKDLAWLALGRVAHEGNRANDAFYYYFQVPQDSERLAEAMFEAAYATYEGQEHDTALDLLDQLEARFPTSPYADEASMLRAYIHLARCEFGEADRLFRKFMRDFGPLIEEVERIAQNPARQAALYDELLRLEGQKRDQDREAQDVRSMLFALLRVDPQFYKLHASVRTLDAEAARAGRLAESFDAIAARLEGSDQPRAAATAPTGPDEAAALSQDIQDAEDALFGLAADLDAMRAANVDPAQIAPHETALSEIATRVRTLRQKLADTIAPPAMDFTLAQADTSTVEGLLARDTAAARTFPQRVEQTRTKLVAAANAAALQALQTLRSRLLSWQRGARIGRIDAVMGSKRRIEIQIESLAAGRFPEELQDPLLMQGLLEDDEEYWPFEGDEWPDEYEEAEDEAEQDAVDGNADEPADAASASSETQEGASAGASVSTSAAATTATGAQP